MDTKFEHLGNVIANATDKERQRFLNQCMEKMQLDKHQLLQLFSDIIDCKSFDYYDSIPIEFYENSNNQKENIEQG